MSLRGRMLRVDAFLSSSRNEHDGWFNKGAMSKNVNGVEIRKPRTVEGRVPTVQRQKQNLH